jgi:hypothetical protein
MSAEMGYPALKFNNHRTIMILTLLNSGRQDLSNCTIIIPKFTFPLFPGGYLFAFEVG